MKQEPEGGERNEGGRTQVSFHQFATAAFPVEVESQVSANSHNVE